MVLPKGTFKGLARVVAPLSFWMAAGWAAYPFMIEKISAMMSETVDRAELDMFSMGMVVACVAAGIGLLIYGYIGKDADDAEIMALGKVRALCPFCGAALPDGAEKCPGCMRNVLK